MRRHHLPLESSLSAPKVLVPFRSAHNYYYPVRGVYTVLKVDMGRQPRWIISGLFYQFVGFGRLEASTWASLERSVSKCCILIARAPIMTLPCSRTCVVLPLACSSRCRCTELSCSILHLAESSGASVCNVCKGMLPEVSPRRDIALVGIERDIVQ